MTVKDIEEQLKAEKEKLLAGLGSNSTESTKELPEDAVINLLSQDGAICSNKYHSTKSMVEFLFGVSISAERKCRVLFPGKFWQKGKIRLRVCVEFTPDLE